MCVLESIFLLFVEAPKCQPPGPLGSVVLGQNMDISGRLDWRPHSTWLKVVISNVKICHLPSSIRRDMRLQHHITALQKLFVRVLCSLQVEKIVQSVFWCKIESSSHPDIDHQLPKFDSKCYVVMPWIQFVCHAKQPVQSSLPEISMSWPSATEPSGPGGWHFGALTKSKKMTSPERTSCDCLLIRFRRIVPRLFPELFPNSSPIVPHSANYSLNRKLQLDSHWMHNIVTNCLSSDI